MIFLIEYDRLERRVVTNIEFEDSEFSAAENARLERELAVNRDELDREVVLLQARDQAALRRTHRRYFENMEQLIREAH
jgi:hypothetical protein